MKTYQRSQIDVYYYTIIILPLSFYNNSPQGLMGSGYQKWKQLSLKFQNPGEDEGTSNIFSNIIIRSHVIL